MPDDTSILPTDARVWRLVEEARAEGHEAGFRECQRRALETLRWAQMQGTTVAHDAAMCGIETMEPRALAPEPPAPAPEKPHE